ncbi:MAG: DUF1223 domain-containing protein [Ruegeria sp.]
MFKSTAMAALIAMISATAGGAEGGPVVVELFTSQGCSSCPPADALMHELAKRDDVIGLALHVDYWDYIGWKDEFADPSHTERQRGYARQGGRTMIYTPQLVINGQEDVVGAKGRELSRLIDDYLSAKPVATIITLREKGALTITLSPQQPLTGNSFDVQVVQYAPLLHASITRGELAGRDLDYSNVVESWQTVGQWDGTAPVTYSVTLTSDLPAAILVQGSGYGPIIAAARAE